MRAFVLLCGLSVCVVSGGAAAAQEAPVPDAEVPQRRELLRTDRFTVYLLDIPPGESTPMHRHDVDIASVFFNSARTVSTFWKQAPRIDPQPIGTVRFRSAGFAHATTNSDTTHFLSVIVAFSRSQGSPDSTTAGRRSDCPQAIPSACAETTTLFCLKDVCVLDVTVPASVVWRATTPVLVVPVTSTVWTTSGSSAGSQARTLCIGTAFYAPQSGTQWRNEGASPARLIAFQVRSNAPQNE